MAQEHRPAPVITIVDPSRPGPLVDVLESHPARKQWRPSVVQSIAGCLSVLLVMASVAVVTLRADLTRSTRAQLASLAQARFFNGLVNRSDPGVLDYLFVLLAPDPTALRVGAVRVVGDGWEAQTGVRHPVFPPRREVVALRHRVDCTQTIRARPSAVVTVVAGRHRRDVPIDLPAGFVTAVQRSQRLACGDVNASDALQVFAGPARRVGDRILVDLGITNASVYDVRILGLISEGLASAVSRTLPWVLAGRAPGPASRIEFRRLGDLPGRRVRVELRLRECLGIGQVLGAPGEAPTVLIQVEGKGGAGSRMVTVEGLAQLESDLLRERCRQGQR